MVKVKIKQPGLFFSIPNKGGFRSPAEICIEEEFIPFIESTFRKAGITGYTIEPFKVKEKKESKDKPPEITTITLEIPKTENLGGVNQRLDGIEELLRILLKKKDRVIKVVEKEKEDKSSRQTIRKQQQVEEMFIPKPDSESFVLVGDSMKFEEGSDISSKVEALIKAKK
jgi:hypothetical protein